MSDLSTINFQIFPSVYEHNEHGEKCCWIGGRNPFNNSEVSLQPYQTDAVGGHSNPEWGFHLLATGQPDIYSLKYVKMSDPSGYWYGVSVDNKKLVLKERIEDTHFIVKKIGVYYTLQHQGKHVECENGNLGKSTTIQLWDITPPTQQQVTVYSDIPTGSFRILWKFVKMDHISGRDWLTKLMDTNTRNNLTIDRLLIPGTHDSGTEMNTTANHTQHHTIPEQVAMGVRYFDLRVANNWDLYHGAYSGVSLEYAVNAVVSHLESHPGEFFFLQITPYDGTEFSSRLYKYLAKNCSSVFKYVYNGTAIPTLNKAKGKIFFFARYTPDERDPSQEFKEYRITWQDNTDGSFALNSPFSDKTVYVQDRYSYSTNDSDKFDNCIKPALNKMFSGEDSNWILNFTSVANGSPIGSAVKINKWVADLLMWTQPFPSGILVIDDARVGNIANIIALNFK